MNAGSTISRWQRLGILIVMLLSACGAPPQTTPVALQVTMEPLSPTPRTPTQAPATPTENPIGRDRLFVRDGYAITVVDVVHGKSERALPAGVASPDWSVIFTANPVRNNQTAVRAVETASGRVLREIDVPGHYTLPPVGMDGAPGGLSANGRWLVLAGSPLADQRVPGEQGKPWHSRFALVSTELGTPAKHFELDGNFWFDAISDDGASLYLIEYLAPEQQNRYQVRLFHTGTAALDPQVVVAKGEDPAMRGIRQIALASPAGSWLYSLYLNDEHGPFIHALDLSTRVAVCIDLPKQGKDAWEQQLLWSLAMSKDGKRLYAVNGALGVVAEVGLDGLQVKRTATLPRMQSTSGLGDMIASLFVSVAEAKRIPVGGAALSADGATLFAVAEQGLVAINTHDFSLRGRYLPGQPLDSVALSRDGKRIYVVNAAGRRVVVLDGQTGQQIGIAKGVTQPRGVLHVADSR